MMYLDLGDYTGVYLCQNSQKCYQKDVSAGILVSLVGIWAASMDL